MIVVQDEDGIIMAFCFTEVTLTCERGALDGRLFGFSSLDPRPQLGTVSRFLLLPAVVKVYQKFGRLIEQLIYRGRVESTDRSMPRVNFNAKEHRTEHSRT